MSVGINSETSIRESTLDSEPNLPQQPGRPLPRQPSRPLQYDQGKNVLRERVESKPLQLVPTFERHYSVKELAELWNLSDRTVRRMFLQEPGVVEWGTCETRMKRGYKTIRIPESVAQRVYRKLRRAG